MQAFIVYNTHFDSYILIGTYEQILDYVLDEENNVMEHYKCILSGSGPIVLLATKADDEKDRVYQFTSARDALRYMEGHNQEFCFSRPKTVYLSPDTATLTSESVSEPSEDTEASGLSWQLEQAAMVKQFRTEAPKESQTQYADSLTALDLSKVYKQHDISMIERGLKYFPLQDWKTIKDLKV